MIEIETSEKWIPAAKDMLMELLGLEPPISYREAAEKMTKHFGVTYTKNACIGMGRRLRVPPRPSPVKKKRDGRFLVRTDAPILPPEAWHPDEGNSLTIYQLRNGDCKWPLGEVDDRPPYLYCGKATDSNLSYCPEHCARSYNKPGKTLA